MKSWEYTTREKQLQYRVEILETDNARLRSALTMKTDEYNSTVKLWKEEATKRALGHEAHGIIVANLEAQLREATARAEIAEAALLLPPGEISKRIREWMEAPSNTATAQMAQECPNRCYRTETSPGRFVGDRFYQPRGEAKLVRCDWAGHALHEMESTE